LADIVSNFNMPTELTISAQGINQIEDAA